MPPPSEDEQREQAARKAHYAAMVVTPDVRDYLLSKLRQSDPLWGRAPGGAAGGAAVGGWLLFPDLWKVMNSMPLKLSAAQKVFLQERALEQLDAMLHRQSGSGGTHGGGHGKKAAALAKSRGCHYPSFVASFTGWLQQWYAEQDELAAQLAKGEDLAMRVRAAHRMVLVVSFSLSL